MVVERQRPVGGGLTDPGVAMDPGAAAIVRELGEEIERLWRRIAELEARAETVAAITAETGVKIEAPRRVEKAGGEGLRLSSDDPEPHGDVADPSSSTTAARAKHVHPGFNWRGTVNTLPVDTPTGPEACFYTDTSPGTGDDRMYFRHPTDTTWRRHQKGTTGTALPTTNVQEGDTFYNTSTSKFYIRINAAWRDLRLVYESSSKLWFDPASGSDLLISHFT